MIKTLFNPIVEEKGRENEIKESILDFLADLDDYAEYAQTLADTLAKEKDLARLRVLRKSSARVQNVREFLEQHLG